MADGDNLILGSQTNSENNRTTLTKNQGFFPVLDLINPTGVGLLCIGGTFPDGPKGEGVSASSPSFGVYGSGGEAGLLGAGPVGIDGITSQSGIGVRGTSDSGIGILGNSNSGIGVQADSTQSVGLYANSTQYVGVYAYSVNSRAVYGTSSNGDGVFGFAQAKGVGVIGYSVNGLAGLFQGPVIVLGDFTVIGGSKSAAVPHPDGSYRRMYSLESPESWFEDFGTAELRDGKAQVAIDPDFVALVHSDPWHIFLTPEGDSKGLYVNSKHAGGFEVREQQGGTSNLRFSYRIVAKRKDILGKRLEQVDLPAAPIPSQPPESPPKPEVPTPHPSGFFKGEEPV
jgi:hypothetical protein